MSQDDPWFAVDLGTALSVLRVVLTNRGDGSGNDTSTLS